MVLSDNKKRKLGNKHDAANLFLGTFSYEYWFKNEESTDTTRKSDNEEPVNLSDMPPPEGDKEEVNKGN